MPLISNFYGVVISMYFNDDEQHHKPHFHARYAGEEASFDFDGNIIAGTFPIKQTKFVVAWVEIHREELSALWELMQTDKQYYKIKGLD